MNRKSLAGALGLAAVATGIAVFEIAVGRRLSRKVARAVTRAARYQSGRLAGLRYRISGRHPDPTVVDSVLADRVRSMLGPIEHRLDIPRVHVLVEGHEVLLYGDVTSDTQAEAIIGAVRDVPGVQAVASHLHIGLFPGDTRPSEGSGHPTPSAALASVLAAAQSGGAPEGSERACARSVLSTFAAILPEGERRHVLTHLPTDLRILVEPLRPRWTGHAIRDGSISSPSPPSPTSSPRRAKPSLSRSSGLSASWSRRRLLTSLPCCRRTYARCGRPQSLADKDLRHFRRVREHDSLGVGTLVRSGPDDARVRSRQLE
jgi:hypothetical protein